MPRGDGTGPMETKVKGRSVEKWMVFWVIVAVLVAYPSFAQEKAESTGSRRFDPKTVETVKGEVVGVDKGRFAWREGIRCPSDAENGKGIPFGRGRTGLACREAAGQDRGGGHP